MKLAVRGPDGRWKVAWTPEGILTYYVVSLVPAVILGLVLDVFPLFPLVVAAFSTVSLAVMYWVYRRELRMAAARSGNRAGRR